ncbi:dehydrogenase/reductase SDR family member 7, partial [Sigmodon hispidus]
IHRAVTWVHRKPWLASGFQSTWFCALTKLLPYSLGSPETCQCWDHSIKGNALPCFKNGSLREKDILVLPLDLTDTSSHEAATKAVLQEFGKIDILVNNSGRSQRSLVLETNLDVFRELINLNYLGTVSLTKCVLPHMIERKQGKIVTVNSIAGIASVALSSGYCASKHALR